MDITEVFEIVNSEVEYAQNLWDKLPRDERPLRDAEKPIEFWVMFIHKYTHDAMNLCYSTDKTRALEAIRKIAALCVRCMENNETPPRKLL